MIVYKVINLKNGKIYIGKAVNKHEKYLGSGKLIKRAIKKYKRENFIKEILEYCSDKEHLNEREVYWIKYFNSTDRNIGYNIGTGGEGGDNISNHPEREHILKKISEKLQGKKHSIETKAKISKANKGSQKCAYWKGKKLNAKHKKNIGLSSNGRKHNIETKTKISQKNKGRVKSHEECLAISKRMKGSTPWNKMDINVEEILKLREKYTLKEISKIVNIKYNTLKKRISKYNKNGGKN